MIINYVNDDTVALALFCNGKAMAHSKTFDFIN